MTARAPSRLARNALVNTAGLALETVGIVLLIPYLVRHLGLSAYGLVTAVIAITLIVQSIGQAVVVTVIQQVATLRERSPGACDVWDEIRAVRRPLGVLAGFGLLGAVVVIVLRTRILGLVLADGSLAGEAGQSLRTIAFALPLLSITNLFPAILRGRQDFVRANTVKVAFVAVRVLGTILVFETLGARVLYYVWIRVGTIILEGVAAFAILARGCGWPRWARWRGPEGSADGAASQFSMIGVLVLYALGNLLLIEVSKILVGRYYGLAVLGVYGAAGSAASFLARLAQASAMVLNPAIASLDSRAENATSDRLVLRSTVAAAVVCGSGAVALLPVWRVIMPLWLGEAGLRLWLPCGLLFAAQGTASAVAPVVQAAYGRGKVVGVSVIHLSAGLLGLGASILVAKTWEGRVLVFIAALALVRVLGAVANADFALTRVFSSRAMRDRARVAGLLLLPWFLGCTGAFAVSATGGGAMAALLAGGAALLIFNAVAFAALLAPGERADIYRFRSRRESVS